MLWEKKTFKLLLLVFFAKTKHKVKAEQLGIFRCQHMYMFNNNPSSVYNLDLSRVHMRNLHPGANLLPGTNLHPGANLHPLASRSYANKLCPYVP